MLASLAEQTTVKLGSRLLPLQCAQGTDPEWSLSAARAQRAQHESVNSRKGRVGDCQLDFSRRVTPSPAHQSSVLIAASLLEQSATSLNYHFIGSPKLVY
jgi:hypothetical protein